ncbi:nuclear transport factor 2 family protein [Nocardia terpenica]|uniref:nuclear transport factor 2 family protein n=1 Tax=Nocardia terpenica TaxID=455432 RepID=UPI0002DA9A44|nr:nuclear transport factor 2 family protein [Nocardia terpenica]MBF6061967.1 nuclear transport factor 2 family protein [Nocardia terpenica]MBF6106233.1 nuclear transport factor 2 family protein [Nocardia terpenica]MBF6110387.1 nuclear transport factor 2 family protein [Nocardia terpenica]MBF6120776.1 nuclear transport factor 2 family protein [Nocardia terpenica]MBF6151723.1 nuclear transport factor 2 family protein [Nocardia terpenica]
MKTLHHLGPSPEHARYQALLPEFWAKVEQQERDAVERGLPVRGLTDFGKAWLTAWATQSLDGLRACLSPDCDFIDSSTFQNLRRGREETLANCAACFEAFPDMAFYPQDDSLRALPFADYTHEQLRMLIPWRGIARWTGPLRLPGTDIVIPPTGRCLNFIGVDRYLLTDDLKISHIDTDWDLLYIVYQLAPLGVREPRLGWLRTASYAGRVLVPLLRGLGRGGMDAHRRLDLPLPAITVSA